MNKNIIKSISSFTAFSVMLITGCKTVVRENIISSVSTGIGATLTENPQTQLYEVRIGYIRNQFYSVPTGKVVDNLTNGTSRTNAADLTPQLVSGIRMGGNSQSKFSLGLDVSENFAVGSNAVNSQAAIAMYIANAKDTNSAKAASEAIKGLATLEQTRQTITNVVQQSSIAKELKGIYNANAQGKRALMLSEAKRLGLVDQATAEKDLIKQIYGALDEKEATTVKLNELLQKVKP
jgi:hypothetical protein